MPNTSPRMSDAARSSRDCNVGGGGNESRTWAGAAGRAGDDACDVALGPSVHGHCGASRRHRCSSVSNRPFIQNRIDPPTRMRLAATFYQYEHDPSLRALVLFGHGEHFSRGIDVDASQAGIIAGQRP